MEEQVKLTGGSVRDLLVLPHDSIAVDISAQISCRLNNAIDDMFMQVVMDTGGVDVVCKKQIEKYPWKKKS